MALHIEPLLTDETGKRIANNLSNFLIALEQWSSLENASKAENARISAEQSASSALTSSANSSASEANAKTYMEKSLEYSNNAFATTPEGYQGIVLKVNKLESQVGTLQFSVTEEGLLHINVV